MNQVIIFCANYLFVFVVIGMVFAWFRVTRHSQKLFLAVALLGCIVALLMSRLAGHLYYDPRPFVTEHIAPLVPHDPDNGFPSDHALLTMTLTAVTYFYHKKIASFMLILTVLVGVARILAKVHSPLDIAGAWIIGIIAAISGYYIIQWLLIKTQKEQPVV
jgi:undecaprenyl-diphosphatase